MAWLPLVWSRTHASEAPPRTADIPLAARSIGAEMLAAEGSLRWFGLRIYEARLWITREGLDPARFQEFPFALELRYQRAIEGTAIARASADEINRMGFGDDFLRRSWLEQMRSIFPDVRSDDRLTGVLRPGKGTAFFRNDLPIGGVEDPVFSRAFFSIWLDPRTAAPELRRALLARLPARAGQGSLGMAGHRSRA